MIVVHAPGGGLGHLTRTLAARWTLGWTEPVVILTSSTRAGWLPLPDGVSLRTIPPACARDRRSLRAWFVTAVHELQPSEVWVDALPAGLRGELDADLLDDLLGSRPVHHLARMVRWERYREATAPSGLRFTSVAVTEPLHPDQERALAATTTAMQEIRLVDEPAAPPRGCPTVALDGEAWLVVHAGPPEETLELLAHARDRQDLESSREPLVVCSPEPPPDLPAGVGTLEAVPVWPLFARAPRVVAGAGANTVRQLAAAGVAHHLVPFERRWDDQHRRARLARERASRTFPLRP